MRRVGQHAHRHQGSDVAGNWPGRGRKWPLRFSRGQIRWREMSATPRPGRNSPPAVRGRSSAVRMRSRSLQASISGRRGAVIMGPAGVGKTVLATVGVEYAVRSEDVGGPRCGNRVGPAVSFRCLRRAPPPRLGPGRSRVARRSAPPLHARAPRRCRSTALARFRRRRTPPRRRISVPRPSARADGRRHRDRLRPANGARRPSRRGAHGRVVEGLRRGADRTRLARRAGDRRPSARRARRPGRHRVAARGRGAVTWRSPLPARTGRGGRPRRISARGKRDLATARRVCSRPRVWWSW